jgi:hypothetical protein
VVPSIEKSFMLRLIKNINDAERDASSYDAGSWGALSLINKYTPEGETIARTDLKNWEIAMPLKPSDGQGKIRLRLQLERPFPDLKNWPAE